MATSARAAAGSALSLRSILVCTDLSQSVARAVQFGAFLARDLDAELHLLTVVPIAEATPLYPIFHLTSDTERIYRDLTEASQRALDQIAEALEPAPKRLVHALRHASFAAPAILDYARELDVDLIVLGTHGRRGLRRFLLGSVAAEVVRSADRPVATCRADARLDAESPQRLLAALDLSEHSTAVIAHARALARRWGSTIDWVHVVARPSWPAAYEPSTGLLLLPDPEELEQRAKSALSEVVGPANGEGERARERTFVLSGDPAPRLVEHARTRESDLIVLASRGLTGLPHVLLGSTAAEVLLQAPCPVLTLRSSGKHWVGRVD